MEDDAMRINIAGRQRMLSQRIAKVAAQIEKNPSISREDPKIEELTTSLEMWNKSNELLRNGKVIPDGRENLQSEGVSRMIQELQLLFQAEYQSGIDLANAIIYGEDRERILVLASQVQEASGPYLEKMNVLVFQYSEEANSRLRYLRFMFYSGGLLLLGFFVISLVSLHGYKREQGTVVK